MHACPVPRCDTEVADTRLLCRECWHVLPDRVRQALKFDYRRRSGTPGYQAALRDAVAYVEEIRR